MKRLSALVLISALLMALCACSITKKDDVPSQPSANVMVLNGTTGFGMAKLMSDAAEPDYPLALNFSVETDASAVTAALISGDCDIAALPTNAAAALYNKTAGGVQIAAINTKGVLYVVANTEKISVSSLADLAGMTVYVPAQTPTWLFGAVIEAAGVDAVIDNTYAQPADLRTALAAGEVNAAVLPEPMVTIACQANEALSPVIDLTAEWDSIYPESSLVQGCLVVRTEFAHEYPAFMEDFLEACDASVSYLQDDPEGASEAIEQTGVFSDAAIAGKAIPNCNVCFLTDNEMKSAMSDFCTVLYGIEPSSIGGALPGDDFYYVAK